MFVVAGVSGKTGKVVAETLLSHDEDVRVVVRDVRQGEPWRSRGAQVAVASLDDEGALARALTGAGGFFTLLPEDMRPADFDAHRLRVVRATCAAVAVSRVPHVVLLSGAAAVLLEGNGLARELRRFEDALRGTRSTVTSLRAVAFQENVAWALPAVRSDGVYPNFYPSADVGIATIATRDIGHVAAGCLRDAPDTSEIVDLVGPVYSVRGMADTVGAALDRTVQVVDIPASQQVDSLIAWGMPRRYAESFVELVGCLASGLVTPSGDRIVRGTTELRDILPGIVAAHVMRASPQ